MIKTIAWMIFAFFCPTASAVQEVCASELDSLLNAIATIESSNDPNAYNAAEDAAGLYQISRIYLKDVNRILGYRKYILADRFDPQKSEEMVRIYLGHYGKNKTLEDIARIHNGGPRGWSRPATKKYWLKIKKWLTKKGGE